MQMDVFFLECVQKWVLCLPTREDTELIFKDMSAQVAVVHLKKMLCGEVPECESLSHGVAHLLSSFVT